MSTGIALPRQHGVDRRIFRAAASVLLAGAIVKVAGACREFVVAGIYGRSDAMDAFLVAFLIPNLLVNLIADSMNQALIPTWIRVSIREGRERAQRLLSNSILALCALLTAVSLIMAALARLTFPLIGSGFALVKLDLSIHLFYGLLPVVFMTGIASSCTAILNACERFAVPALAQLVMPVTIVAGALLLEPRLGIWALVYATVLGSFLHASLVAGMMHARGFRIQLLSKAKGMSCHPERSAAGRAVEGSAVVFFLRSRISVLQESIISRLKASRAVLKAHDLGVWGKIRITTCLVPVHDFSRAATGAKRVRALSPEGYGYRPQSADRHSQYSDENTRTVVRQFGPLLLSSLVASGGLLVDQAMAAMLPSGSVSALVFATRFVSVVVTLMAGAVSSALAP